MELQADDTGRLWLMLYSGSRGIGQAIRDHHLAKCTTGRSGLRFLDADSGAGGAYVRGLAWALEYAEASRLAMVSAVREVIERVRGVGADEASYMACNHNHVRREVHDGETLWVHRKGAVSAAAGEQGVIPGPWEPAASTSKGGAVWRRCRRALTEPGDG